MSNTATTPSRLADAGAMLVTAHRLEGGLTVRLRLTRPSDGNRLQRFLEGLPAEIHLRRFGASPDELDGATVRGLTFYDPRERLVIAATAAVPGDEEIVGLAEVALSRGGTADIGVVVDDASRGNGVGRLLTEAVASLAARHGATHLRARMLDRDPIMVSLMEGLGPTVTAVEDGSAVAYTRLPAHARRAA